MRATFQVAHSSITAKDYQLAGHYPNAFTAPFVPWGEENTREDAEYPYHPTGKGQTGLP